MMNLTNFLLLLALFTTTNAGWTTATVETSGMDLVGIAGGSKIFFAGGLDLEGLPRTTIDILDSSSGNWLLDLVGGLLSIGRSGLAATTAEDIVLFSGGHSGTLVSSIIDRYDLGTSSMLTVPLFLETARTRHASCSNGDLAFFAGGVITMSTNESTWIVTSSVEVYSVSAGGFIASVGNLSIGRYDIACAVHGTKVYFAGGKTQCCDSQSSSVIDIYDISTELWSTTQLSIGRYGVSALTVDDKIYFAGGTQINGGNETSSDVVDVWDAVNNTWTTGLQLSIARSHIQSQVAGDTIIFGSGQSSLTGDEANFRFDMFNRTNYSSLGYHISIAPHIRYASAAVGNTAYFVGGPLAGVVADVFDGLNSSIPTPTPTPIPSPNPTPGVVIEAVEECTITVVITVNEFSVKSSNVTTDSTNLTVSDVDALSVLCNTFRIPTLCSSSSKKREAESPCSWTDGQSKIVCTTDENDEVQITQIAFSQIFLRGNLNLFAGFSHLVSLSLNDTGTSGTIPTELSRLSKLQLLRITLNALEGTIPTQLGLMTELVSLTLTSNQLNGTIPSSLGNIQLTELRLDGNLLDGPVPDLPFINVLLVNNNNITGITINGGSKKRASPSNLTVVNLGSNYMIQDLSEFCELTNLVSLSLVSNRISGTIPSCLGTLGSLAALDLSNNLLTGSVPSTFNQLSTLMELSLDRNKVYRLQSISKLTQLRKLSLRYNSFASPSIPTFLAKFTNLTYLDLTSNKISGVIPIEFRNLTSLRVLITEGSEIDGGLFNFPLKKYEICFLGDSLFSCTRPAPLSCTSMNCYSDKEPCETLNKCDADATCVPNEDEYWYTCVCPSYLGNEDQYTCNDGLSRGAIAGIVVGSVAAVIIILILIFLLCWQHRRRHLDLSSLPETVRSPYLKFHKHPDDWVEEKPFENGEPYYLYELKKGTSDYSQMIYLWDSLEGAHLEIASAYIVYNRKLLSQFVVAASLMETRFQTSPGIFLRQPWRTDENAEWRKQVIDHQSQVLDQFPFNSDRLAKIVPLAHGTTWQVGKCIAATGFANLSSTDDGYYGKGIYFTSSVVYAYPYYARSKDPTIIVSWVLSGNSYPVIEAKNSPNNLCGKAMVSGFNSHYVLTNPDGTVRPSEVKNPQIPTCNEWVIAQESQIVPLYLIRLGTDNLKGIYSKWTKGGNEETSRERRHKYKSILLGENVKSID